MNPSRLCQHFSCLLASMMKGLCSLSVSVSVHHSSLEHSAAYVLQTKSPSTRLTDLGLGLGLPRMPRDPQTFQVTISIHPLLSFLSSQAASDLSQTLPLSYWSTPLIRLCSLTAVQSILGLVPGMLQTAHLGSDDTHGCSTARVATRSS